MPYKKIHENTFVLFQRFFNARFVCVRGNITEANIKFQSTIVVGRKNKVFKALFLQFLSMQVLLHILSAFPRVLRRCVEILKCWHLLTFQLTASSAFVTYTYYCLDKSHKIRIF